MRPGRWAASNHTRQQALFAKIHCSPRPNAGIRRDTLREALMEKTILRLPQVKARVGLGHTNIYNRIKAGTFPAPVSLGARAVGWISTEIDEWIDNRAAARCASAGVATTKGGA